MNDSWITRPMTILGQIMDPQNLPTDPAEQVRCKRELGFCVEHWLGSRLKTGGDDGRSYYFETRYGCIEDRLGPYLKVARAQGLRVLVYLNVHWFEKDFPAAMLARNADGSSMGAYGAGVLVCPSGPFRRFATELVEDLMAYPIDGVFLDGPCAATCWCGSCRELYRQQHGAEMPSGILSLGQRRQLERWNAQRVASFIRDIRQTLRAHRPGGVVYHNGDTLGHVTWTNRAAIGEEDLLGIEGGFIGYGPLQGQQSYKTSASAKMLDCLAGGKPTVIFNDHGFKRYDYYPLPRAELDLLWAATVAGGANPWFLMYASNFDTQAADAARAWNRFIAEHQQTLADTRAAETAALLWSDTSLLAGAVAAMEEDSVHETGSDTTSRAAMHTDHAAAFWGAYALLTRSAIPFRVVTEHELTHGLPPIDLLVAPSVVALEETALDGLSRFVAAGGTLVADDEFALLGGEGRPRRVDQRIAAFGAATTDPLPVALADIDYFDVADARWARGLTRAPLPRPTRAYRTESQAAEALAHFYRPLAGRYDDLPSVSDMPAILLHRKGHGRVILLAMNLFEHYNRFSFDDHRQLLANLLGDFHRPIVVVNGLHGRGEVLLRRKRGKLLVHLLNYNGNVRPFTNLLPLRDLSLTVNPQWRVSTASALHSGKPLEIHPGEQGQTILLPELGPAETVVLELQQEPPG